MKSLFFKIFVSGYVLKINGIICFCKMKRVIMAFDSFKGSLTSREAGEAAARGVKRSRTAWETEVLAIADGGEGTMEAISGNMDGEIISLIVRGPVGSPVEARYLADGETALIEVAQACGLTLIPDLARNPEKTSTFGVGQMIIHALGKGCRKFRLCLGGSATNDAGVGMLRALGFRFYDSRGHEIGDGGEEVGRIVSINRDLVDTRLMDCEFIIVCDVDNPLCGPEGASLVFGPQKGADPAMQSRLDKALESFAGVTAKFLGMDFSKLSGSGAAGGLGFAFIAFLNACRVRGIDMVLDMVDFDSYLRNADLVITGEGKIDLQTSMGKAPFGVLERARKFGVPVIAVGGTVEPTVITSLLKAGFRGVFDIVDGPMSLKEAMRKDVAMKNVEKSICRIFRTF